MEKVNNSKDALKEIKKGNDVWLDERIKFIKKEKYETTFSLEFIIRKIALRECLLCEINLDKDIGKEKWHIPLCRKHRNEYLEEEFKEMKKGKDRKKWNKKKF